MFVESWIPFVLKAFACRSSGNAFVYLPLIMEATSAGGAILLRKRSLGLGEIVDKYEKLVEKGLLKMPEDMEL